MRVYRGGKLSFGMWPTEQILEDLRLSGRDHMAKCGELTGCHVSAERKLDVWAAVVSIDDSVLMRDHVQVRLRSWCMDPKAPIF